MFYSSMQAIYNSLIVHVSEQSEDHLTWLSATQVTDCHALPAAGRPRSESKTMWQACWARGLPSQRLPPMCVGGSVDGCLERMGDLMVLLFLVVVSVRDRQRRCHDIDDVLGHPGGRRCRL